MSTHRNAKDIFFEATQKTSEVDRERYVNEACGSDSQLRSKVKELLAADDEPESFLDHPAVQTGVMEPEDYAMDDDRTAEARKVGSQIGPYKNLLEQRFASS